MEATMDALSPAVEYPARVVVRPALENRDRLGVLWAFTTALAWVIILITGRYPEALYGFAPGVMSWGVRVEAYLLLLTDEYPPFTLRA